MTQRVRVQNFTVSRDGIGAGQKQTLARPIAPVEYGTGLRLWEQPEELEDRFHLEQVTAPSGVTHCFFWRR